MRRMLLAPVLAAYLSLPRCYKERHDPYQETYITDLATVVAEVAKNSDEAAALGSITTNESANCIYVQEHYTHSGGYSAFQLEGKAHKYPGPFIGLELSSMRNAANAAVDVWRHTWNCGSGFANRMTSYAGKPCGKKWKTLDKRVNTYWYLKSFIDKEMKKIEQQQREQESTTTATTA